MTRSSARTQQQLRATVLSLQRDIERHVHDQLAPAVRANVEAYRDSARRLAPVFGQLAESHIEVARALEGWIQTYPGALAEGIVAILPELYPDAFTGAAATVAVRDLDVTADEDQLVESMARWIFAEMKAARTLS